MSKRRLTMIGARELVAAIVVCVVAGGVNRLRSQETSGTGETCTMRCICDSARCSCLSSGGQGSFCSSSGEACTVYGCEPQALAAVRSTPDGVAIVGHRFSSVRSHPLAEGTATAWDNGRWEAVAEGRAVARQCGGVIVALYADPSAAIRLRKSTDSFAL